MSLVFSTDDHAKRERAEYWRHVVSNDFAPMEFDPVGREVHCRARLRSVASIRVLEVRSSAGVLKATPAAIRRNEQGYGKVELVLGGKLVVSQDGRQAVLKAGDFAIHDTNRPFELIVTENVRLVGALWPLRMVAGPRNGLRDLTATRMAGRTGSGALLASFLAALGSEFDDILPPEEARISSAAGDLLAAALAHHAGDDTGMGPDGRRSVLVLRIRQFVEANIADSGMNPATIAAAHCISVRQLHRLFEGEDVTVTDLIRVRRLEGSRNDLADPALCRQSIGAISSRWGIPDSAKFSRMFRAAYDASPREYRTAAPAGRHRRPSG